MAEIRALNSAAGELDKRLNSLNSTRLANGNLIRDVQTVAAPKFQWDEGLRQSDKFVRNLQKGKIEIEGIKDLWDKISRQSASIAENQVRLANASVRQNSSGQIQMYVPSTNEVNNFADGIAKSNAQLAVQNAMLQAVSTQVQNWGKNVQWAGRQLMVGLTIPFAAGAAAAGVYAFNIDKEITRITKVYNGAQSEVQGLALETARTVSQTMGQASKDTLSVMADLAAVGKTGQDLVAATKEVQRLATLGDMDQQTALKSYITLQSTFKVSTEDTADAINYMNAVADATSLGVEDFAEALPRAAAPVAQLGGSLQDLGTVLVALKERGVDAAEGSNAIKTLMNRLINPAKETQLLFKELTGQDMDAFIEKTGGELMPTMQALADVIMNGNMSILEQQQLIGKLGGAYQLTRLTAILDGLASKSGQVEKAIEVAAQGESKWAAQATRELEAVTTSVSGKFKIAMQTFKDELFEFGQTALRMATFVMEKVGAVMSAINSMPDFVKEILIFAGTFLAVIGPMTMLVGIFANFIGTIGKAIAWITRLGRGYQTVTIESKLAEIQSGKLSSKFASEAEATQILIYQLERLQKAYVGQTAAAQAAASATSRTGAVNTATTNVAKATSAEVAAAERMAYLMQDQRAILSDPKQYAAKSGVFTNADSRREFENLTEQIRTQENYLTQAINHRKIAVTDALRLEKEMLLAGLQEQAAAAKLAAVGSTGDPNAMPSIISVGENRYRQNSAGKWINAQNGRFPSRDELIAINQGFSQISTTSDAVANNTERASLATKLFRQDTLLAVSAASALGGAVADSGSAAEKWLNGIALGAGALSLIVPLADTIKDKFANSDLMSRMTGDESKAKAKLRGFIDSSKSAILGLGRLLMNPVTLGLGALATGAYVTYQLVTAEGRKNVENVKALANTTNGWMKSLGQAKLEWGQIKDSAGQVNDSMGAMVNKLRTENQPLVEAVSRASGENLDSMVRGEVYRLQGQGLNKEDILKGMETLLNAAGKTRDEISRILSDIKVKFNFDGPMSDIDIFLSDLEDKVSGFNAAGGKRGFFDNELLPTELGRANIEVTASLIKDRLTGLDETSKKYVAGQISDSLNDTFNDGFQELRRKHGDQINANWQTAAQELLFFEDKQNGWNPILTYDSSGEGSASEAQKDLAKLLNNNRILAIELKESLNLPIENKNIKGFGDLVRYIGVQSMNSTEVQKEYNEAIKKAEQATGKLTDEEKIQIATMYAQVRGLDASKLAADGYSDAQRNSKDAVEEASRGIELFVTQLREARNAHSDLESMVSGTNDFWSQMADADSGFSMLGGDAAAQAQSLNDAIKSIYSNTMNAAYDIASTQMEQQYQARMDGIADYYDNIRAGMERESDALDDRWSDRMDSFSDAWKERMQNVEDSYESRKRAIESESDAQVKAIDDQIEAIKEEQDVNDELEDQRKKMFEAEERRIERLTELANANINYNRALAEGNLDEAARVMNNTERMQIGWGSEDSQRTAEDRASATKKAQEQNIKELEDRKEAIKEAKDAKLQALDDEEKAVERSLERQQEMEKRNLEAQKENEKERLQARIDGLQKEQQMTEESERRKQEMNRRTLEIELATLKAFVPMNEEQLWAHIGRVQGAYDEHGVSLQFKGTQWGQIVGTALQENVNAARINMQNSADWQTSGSAIADSIAKGAFNMSLQEFFQMLISGEPPANWKPPGSSKAYSPNGNDGMYRVPGTNIKYYHTGGEIGFDTGGRAGKTGGLHSDEIPIVAQRGEFMFSKDQVNRLGPQTLRDLATGKIGIGGPDMGIAGLGAAMAAVMMRSMLMATFLGSQEQRESGNMFTGQIGQKPGMYGNVSLGDEQIRNANIIASVGRSMGASQRDIIISFMTAMQESGIRNINYGDRDSLGLFQQRPSQGWGSPAQILNPEYASRKFFETLFTIRGREAMPLTVAAQAVQRSAFPEAYAKWEAMARALAGSPGMGDLSGGKGLAGFGMFARMLSGSMNSGGAGTRLGRFTRPTNGAVTSEFGLRWGAHHDGIDIGAPTGTPIYAVEGGVVTQAGWNNGGFGNWTLIDHGGGLMSGYAHQSSIGVRAGQQINNGQTIGYVGSTGKSTGPHLHFQMGPGPGRFQNPRNWIPSLDVGGTINYDNVLANLHRDETVLTSPLSASLERGINNMENNSVGDTYSFTINGTGKSDNELKAIILDVMETHELRKSKKLGIIKR